MPSAAVFGKPETGGVRFDTPSIVDAPPFEEHEVEVTGYITVRIYVRSTVTVTAGMDEDAIIDAALDDVPFDGELEDQRLSIYDETEIDRKRRERATRAAVLAELEAWKRGEPIKVNN